MTDQMGVGDTVKIMFDNIEAEGTIMKIKLNFSNEIEYTVHYDMVEKKKLDDAGIGRIATFTVPLKKVK